MGRRDRRRILTCVNSTGRQRGHDREQFGTASAISWNYTTWLNIIFPVIAAALAVRFVTSVRRPDIERRQLEPGTHHLGSRPLRHVVLLRQRPFVLVLHQLLGRILRQ